MELKKSNCLREQKHTKLVVLYVVFTISNDGKQLICLMLALKCGFSDK